MKQSFGQKKTSTLRKKTTDMNKTKKMTFVEKFINGQKIRPSDFRFEWRVSRDNSHNWKAFEDEMTKTGIDKMISKSFLSKKDEEKCKKQILELFAKHTKSWYIYSLSYMCVQQDKIVKAMLSLDKEARDNVMKSSNYALLQHVNSTKAITRRFSSLSSMQKYADKNNLSIDVYSLWETMKKCIKENRNGSK